MLALEFLISTRFECSLFNYSDLVNDNFLLIDIAEDDSLLLLLFGAGFALKWVPVVSWALWGLIDDIQVN